MAEKVYDTSKLINLHSADGTTLLIPKIPLSTVDNNAYTVDAEGNITTKGAGSSLQAAVQAEIAAAVADSVVGNYVPWTDGSNVVIPGTLTAEGAVRVEGKLVAAKDMYIEITSDGATTSTKVATMADIDDITGGTLNNYYTKGEVDAIAEGALEDANVYTDAASSALDSKVTALDTKVTTDYATKTYVGEQIAAIDHLKREIVQGQLPALETADPTTIYMVPSVIGEGEAARTVYVEYMVINGAWETIGDSDVQLVNYYTKEETDGAIADALDSLKVDGKDLKSYIDAQDGSTLTAANTYADAAVSAASSALNDSITAVDDKFANYYDKDGIDAFSYATITQVNTASSTAVTEAIDYTDQQLANYLDSTAASQAFILREEIATPFSHIVYTSVLGSHTFDLELGMAGDSVTVYTTSGAHDTFAPLDGATMTNVVSISGDAAHIAVARVTTTELQVVNEVELEGIIVGRDSEGGALTHITESQANFENVNITSTLYVGEGDGSVNIMGTLDVTNVNVASNVSAGAIATNSLDVAQGLFTVYNGIDAGGGAGLKIDTDTLAVDTESKTVQVYDEWTTVAQDGSTVVSNAGLANVATEHDISSVMQALDKTILYDILEDEQI